MRTNGGVMGPLNAGPGGIWRIDDHRGSGYRHPVLESGAGADNYVCEFDGGASANETGVGLGLAGADLVLTQVGGVPGASGGYRALGTGQYFTGPTALIDACLRNAGGRWTVMLQLADWTSTLEQAVFMARSGAPVYQIGMYQDWNGYVAEGRPAVSLYSNGSPSYNGPVVAEHPTSGAMWMAMWEDGEHGIRLGWKTGAQPTSWRDFPESQRMSTGVSGAGWPSFTAVNYVVSGVMKVKSLTLSKIPLGG